MNRILAASHNPPPRKKAEQEKFQPALEAFRQASNLDPDDARPHTLAGKILQRMGQPEEALAEFRAALDLDPGNPAVQYEFVEVVKEQGKLEQAAIELQEAIDLAPTPEAYGTLGLIFKGLEKLEDALQAFRIPFPHFLRPKKRIRTQRFKYRNTVREWDMGKSAIRNPVTPVKTPIH